MRRRALIVAALALGVGAPLGAFALAGDEAPAEDKAQPPTALAWAEPPREIAPEPGLEDDHILIGRLRNTALRSAGLDVERVRVRTAGGRELKTSTRFLHVFAHGIYSADMINRNGPPPDSERRRLGEIATVRPGDTVPITVSWRGDGAAELDLGGATIPLP